MFLNKDSPKQDVQEDYYCLITALFFPWNFDTQLNPNNISWKQFFHDNRHHLSPRLSRYIDNLDLLHKTREETRIDYLLRRSQEGLQVPSDLSSILFDDNIEAVVEHAILDIVNRFTLNDEQKLAVRIIADHSTGRSKVG